MLRVGSETYFRRFRHFGRVTNLSPLTAEGPRVPLRIQYSCGSDVLVRAVARRSEENTLSVLLLNPVMSNLSHRSERPERPLYGLLFRCWLPKDDYANPARYEHSR